MPKEPFVLLREVDTLGFGDTAMKLGDLDCDGELEAVWFQSRNTRIPRISAGGYVLEQRVHAVTAMKLDGEVLWQEGAPMGHGYWGVHGGAVFAAVADIDADGVPEIVHLTERDGRSYLRVLEADWGQLRREVETGANCVLQLCDIRGLGADRDILVSTWLNPIYIYADDLTCLWNCHFYGGAGHRHAFADINGDGKDELFIGYCCVLPTGLKLWWRPDLEPHLEEMTRAPHVDQLQVHDIDEDGRPELLMIAGKDLIVLDAATGTDRWMFPGKHIQHAAVGRFLPDLPGRQIFVTERAPLLTGYMLDCNGRELWRKESAGYGETFRLAGRELDFVFVRGEDQRPAVINGQGNLVQELDMPVAAYKYPRKRRDTHDTGVLANYTIADTNGDGRQEILAYNRTHLWHWVQD